MAVNKTVPVSATSADDYHTRPVVTPHVDIYEGAEELLVVADVPGLSLEGVHVNFEKDTLTFEGEAFTGDHALASKPFVYRRSFRVPRGVDAAQIGASLAQGVLTIRLPKAEHLKPRRIHVNVG